MKFGCCTNMIAACPDGTGIEHVESLARAGYDYVELPLAQIMDLSHEEFGSLKRKMEEANIPCEACNNFFPARIRLTGENTDKAAISEYTEAALDRAAQLGAKTVVFGSSGAKNVPGGFPHEKAWTQLVFLLRNIDEAAGKHGITVAIEPLNRLESNIINTAEEGLRLAQDVNRANIKLLVDYYHLAMEKESPDILKKAGKYIRHVHFARPEGRVFPGGSDPEDYSLFFKKLADTGYDGRVSVEAYSRDFAADFIKSLELLKAAVK